MRALLGLAASLLLVSNQAVLAEAAAATSDAQPSPALEKTGGEGKQSPQSEKKEPPSPDSSAKPSPTDSSRTAKRETKLLPPHWVRVSPRRCNLLMFSGSGQFVTGNFAGAKDSLVVGYPGSVVSTDHGIYVLHTGRLLVAPLKGTASIGTKSANVEIEEGGVAVIDCVPAKHIRIAALGKNTASVRVALRGARSLPSTLKSGGQMIVNEQDKGVTKEKFDIDEFKRSEIETMQPLNEGPVRSAYTRMASYMNLSKPESYVPAAPEADTSGGPQGAPIRLLASPGTQFRHDGPGVLSVRNGAIFLQMPERLTIRTSQGEVHAKKGALLDVEHSSGVLRVKALSGPDHTFVTVGTRELPVHPGQEVLITNRTATAEELQPPDGVGRRRVDSVDLDGGKKCAVSDFSIISFINNAPHLQTVKNGASADDKRMSEQMLKTAAAVHMLTQGKGAYKSVTKPKKTAPTTPGRRSGGSA